MMPLFDNSFNFSGLVNATLADSSYFAFLKPGYSLASSGLLKLEFKAPQAHLSNLLETGHVDMELHRIFKIQ